jgi:hypothetical protein
VVASPVTRRDHIDILRVPCTMLWILNVRTVVCRLLVVRTIIKRTGWVVRHRVWSSVSVSCWWWRRSSVAIRSRALNMRRLWWASLSSHSSRTNRTRRSEDILILGRARRRFIKYCCAVARKYDFYATFIIDTPVAILPSGIFIVVITAVPVTTGEDSVTVAIASRGLFDVGGAFLATIIDTCTHGGF